MLYTFPGLINEFDIFFNNYDIEELIVCPSEKITDLKPKEERICRFCGLNYSQTTFKKEAHIISAHLGNKYLVSDFECDKCNKFFGDNYEDDLAAFLGMSRTILGVKNRYNKIPTFKSPGKMLVARREEFYGIKEGIKVSREESTKGIFNIDAKFGKTEITYQKHPYTPIKVYKALLKIALSIIPEQYVADYRHAFEYLFKINDKPSDLAKVLHCELPYNHKVENPVCLLFKKLDSTKRTITHVFALYLQNYVFEFPIPFSEVDKNNDLYNGKPYSIPLCPPILFSEPESEATFFRTIIDLSSNESVRGEIETITFSMDTDRMDKLKAYNPTTGEITDAIFNPDDIIGIYFAPQDSKASFPKN